MFLNSCKGETFKNLENVIAVGEWRWVYTPYSQDAAYSSDSYALIGDVLGLKFGRLLMSRLGFVNKGLTKTGLKRDG